MAQHLCSMIIIISVVTAGYMIPVDNPETLESPVIGAEDNPSSYAFLEWEDEASWGPWGLEISDVDLNGGQEILVGSSGQNEWDFRIYDGVTHDLQLEDLFYPYQWHHTVAAGNVNDDPLEEIVLSSIGNPDIQDTIAILQWNGATLSQIWASGDLLPRTIAAALLDVDQDGRNEVFGLSHETAPPGGYSWDHLFEIDYNSTSGDFEVVNILSLKGESLHHIKFYDIDKDGVQEIVLRSSVAIYAIDSKTMKPEWSIHESELFGVGGHGGIDVGDPDEDGEVEIVASGQFDIPFTTIAWIDVQTRSVERMTPPVDAFTWVSDRLVIHDVDQDSVPEIVVPIAHDYANSSGGYLVILDGRSGAVEFRSSNFVNSDNYVGSVEVGNVDSDPDIEILVTSYVEIRQYQVNSSAPTQSINAVLDCHPGTLNLKSKGNWITCYVELPHGYDPRDINASTMLLNGVLRPELNPKYGFVADEQSYIVDHDGNGIEERMVKFDRSAVQAMASVGTFVLEIRGILKDGTEFDGSDAILVINPPKAVSTRLKHVGFSLRTASGQQKGASYI